MLRRALLLMVLVVITTSEFVPIKELQKEGESLMINQSQVIFKYDLSQIDDEFVNFRLSFGQKHDADITFCYSLQQNFTLQVCDLVGSYLRESSYNLKFQNINKISKLIYLKIEIHPKIDQKNPQYQANICVRYGPSYECTGECSGQGICIENQRGCLCNEEYLLGSECQIKGDYQEYNKVSNYLVFPKEWRYIYFKHDYGVKVTLNKLLESELRVFIQAYDKRQTRLPGLEQFDNFVRFPAEEKSIDIDLLSFELRGFYVMGVYNAGSTLIEFRTHITQSGRADFLQQIKYEMFEFIVMSVLGVFGSFGFIYICSYLLNRRQQMLKRIFENQQNQYFENNNPVLKYHKQSEIDLENENDVCPICTEDFQEGQLIRQMICNHIFHQGCIDQWCKVKKACPKCRQTFLEEQGEQNLNTLDHNYNYV